MKRAYIFLLMITGPLMALGKEGHHGSHHGNHYHSYELPASVIHTLADRYHHFDLIHTSNRYRYGRTIYDVLIQHHDGFAMVSVGNGGRFFQERFYDHYPLNNHYCNDYCGFQYQHYQDGRFATYDPYSGCNYHIGLLSKRYPRYAYRPYYGYGSLYYNPWYGHYKRFRRYQPNYGWGYYLHNRPYHYYSHKYRNKGIRHSRNYGRHHQRGWGKYGYGRKYSDHRYDDWDHHHDRGNGHHAKRKGKSHYGDNSQHGKQDQYRQRRHRSHYHEPQRRGYQDDDDRWERDDDDRRKRDDDDKRRKEWDRRRGKEIIENPGKDARVRERRRS